MDKATTSFRRLEGQRWVSLIIDCSEAMKDTDMPPNRLIRLMVLLPAFINQFFDMNPLSQLQIIETSDGLAKIVSTMSGNADGHIKALRDMILAHRNGTSNKASTLYQGSASIQNALLVALKAQRSLPKYGRREILMVLGAMASLDPSHPASCIPLASATRTSISTFHLAAEMYICKRLATETGGTLLVPLSENHLVAAFDSYALQGPTPIAPSPYSEDPLSSQARILVMGFPLMEPLEPYDELEHLNDPLPITTHFTCPRCDHLLPATAALPTNCPICRLMLVKFQQLARSYALLFPQPSFQSHTLESEHPCYGCHHYIPPTATDASAGEKSVAPTQSFGTLAGISSLSNVASSSAPSSTLVQEQCFICDQCKSLYCGACKEGITAHLHQCVGCMEQEQTL